MKTFHIRPAQLEDAAILSQVERSAAQRFRTVPGLEWIADDTVQDEKRHRDLIRVGLAWVAVEGDGLPMGFANAEIFGNDLHLWEISVAMPHQGRGIGQGLIAAVVDEARQRGLERVTLSTFREIAFNEAFYRCLGFVTLTSERLDDRLRAVLDEEMRNGMPAGGRCAMEMRL